MLVFTGDINLTDSHFIRIDCSDADGAMLPPDEIFAKIKAEVDSVLGL